MEPCRSLALLTGSLGLAFTLVAISTDFWIVAMGATSAHSGLWPKGSQEDQIKGKGQALPRGDGQAGGCTQKSCLRQAGYIHVTQSFCILAALWGLVAVGFLVLSCIPSLAAPGRGPLVSTITAFAAGKDPRLGLGTGVWALDRAHLSLLCLSPALSMLVAMAVYTSERWGQTPHSQVQTFFCWSFYMGWVSAVLFLCTGDYKQPACLPGEAGRPPGQGGTRGEVTYTLCHPRCPESGRSLWCPAAQL